MQRRKRIAAMMAGVEREYQHALTQGMARATRAAGIDLCVFNCQGHSEGPMRSESGARAIFSLPDIADFDGVVLMLATIPAKSCRDQIRAMLDEHPDKPLVTIDVRHGQSVQVGFDDVVSVRELMRHLIETHGRRRFALVTGPKETRVARARYEAACAVLAEYGLSVPAEAVYDGRWVRDGGREAAQQFLEQLDPLPDAIVCGNDDMAFGVAEVLWEAGLEIPQDVCVTGFDARREAVGRGLTTIRRPVTEAGELAIRTLIDWMANGRPAEDEVTLPTSLIFGDSCGCDPVPARAAACVEMLSAEQRLMEKCMRQTTEFVSLLASLTTRREVGAELVNFAADWNAREMHVCVNPGFLEAQDQNFEGIYPDEMLLLSSWSHGKGAAQQRFSARQLLPLLDQPREEPMAVVFAPLEYMDNNLGYMVFDVEHVVESVLPSLLLLVSSSLMSLALRSTVRTYANVLERMSVRDALTGLYNRRGMQQLIPPMFEKARQQQLPFAVVCCDMDDLKHINDSFGHLSGDEAINRLARAIRVLEKEGLTCIHISGDEFLALGILPQVRTAEELREVTIASVDRMNREEPWLCSISFSSGAYVGVPGAKDKLEDFILQADNSMYLVKHSHHRRIGRLPNPKDYNI